MEQDVEDERFENMMDVLINELISYALGVDTQRNIDEAIEFLSTASPRDAILSISESEAKQQLTTTFGQEYEIGAIEIMMQICIKILSMRKLVLEYPMIFVPLSFEKYQPRFMTKKSQRKHKLKKQMKRQQTISPQMTNKINQQHKRLRSGSRHKHQTNKQSLTESINNTNINKIVPNVNSNIDEEDDESLSDLSGDNETLRDENLNQRMKNNNIKHYPMKSKSSHPTKSDNEEEEEEEEEDKNDPIDPNENVNTDEDNPVIARSKSTPSDTSNRVRKHKTMQKQSRTRS